jgi:hypothetical protein
VIAIILDSCGHCKNNNYDIDKINLKNLIYTPGAGRYCSTFDETDTTIFQYLHFGIRIKFNSFIYSNIYRSYSLINSAMAAECWDSYTLKHKIENITIISLNDFDQNHAANSDISSYFKATDNQCDQLSSIDSTLNHERGINYQHTGAMVNFDLILIKPPQSDSLFRFVVKVKLSNNELIDTTEIIRIKK